MDDSSLLTYNNVYLSTDEKKTFYPLLYMLLKNINRDFRVFQQIIEELILEDDNAKDDATKMINKPIEIFAFRMNK